MAHLIKLRCSIKLIFLNMLRCAFHVCILILCLVTLFAFNLHLHINKHQNFTIPSTFVCVIHSSSAHSFRTGSTKKTVFSRSFLVFIVRVILKGQRSLFPPLICFDISFPRKPQPVNQNTSTAKIH